MRKFKQLLMVLIMMLFVPMFVSAAGIVEADDQITTEGEYYSNKVIAGDKVTNEAYIDGLALLTGNSVKNNGKLSYGFLAGNDITIKGEIEKDLFAAGNDITIEEDAIIPRDVYLAGNKVVIKANIGRTLYVTANTLDLRDVTVNGNVKTAVEEILVNDNTVINGTLSYEENTIIGNLDAATINDVVTYKESTVKPSFKEEVIDTTSSTIALLVTVLVLFIVFKQLRETIDEIEFDVASFVKNIILGFAFLIVVPVASVLLMITGVFLPLSLIALALYAIVLYLSVGIGSYVIGRLLWNITKKDHNWFIDLIIGIVLVNIVGLIPVVGEIVESLITFYGIGLIASLLKPSK